MADRRKIFVVLDPTCMEQATLVWAEQIALELKSHRSEESILHVYCCMSEDSVALAPQTESRSAIEVTHQRVSDWVARLVAHSTSLGLEVETEIEWNSDWRNAIVAAVDRAGSNLVIKNMSQHTKVVRMVRETSDWRLISDCECPILLVKTGRPFSVNQVLVAIKHKSDDAVYEAANDRILETARGIAADLGANLHAVTCYESTSHPDRQRFADRCDLQRNQVTAAEGVPEKVIAQAAAKINADILIIARITGKQKDKRGSDTAKRLIDEVDTDVLVIPIKG